MRRSALSLGPTAVVWTLGVTQIVGYGTLYYSFAILAGDVAVSFAVPVSRIFGLFSLALLVGGFAAPFVGRWIDRHGAPRVMAAGSVAASVALAAVALAPGPTSFAAALILMEVVSAAVLYDAAFTALVQIRGRDARRRIGHLTLIAGFASTIFWPLTTWLHGWLDWRSVMLAFAAANLIVAAPLHLLLLAARPGRDTAGDAPERTPAVAVDPPPPPALARRMFVLVTAGFALSGFLLSALLAQMVPALTALGLGGSALVVSTLFGPAQVLVRFVNLVFGVRRHPLFVTLFGMTMLPLAVLILATTAPAVAGAVVFAVLLGFGSGLKSIVQGTLPLALFGTASYGSRLGRMALARQFLAAAAPFAFAWQLETRGPTVALATLVAVGLLGLAAFAAVARLRDRAAAPSTITAKGRP
ncbi:arsenite efflux MFS transporter ArsK [Oharaeibacter diazotrophicus]|nr:arsenite efflux MFS transporter ArsK [Oharaeibacter diazotrophicus]GLS77468.1 MFS transporter [Oharaeibacter diazotrophicus]